MRSEKHKGYMVLGHAIHQQRDILQTARYAARGTITQDNRGVEASDVLGEFETEEEAGAGGHRMGTGVGGRIRLIRYRLLIKAAFDRR